MAANATYGAFRCIRGNHIHLLGFGQLNQRSVITFVVWPRIALLDKHLLTNLARQILVHDGLFIAGKLFHRQSDAVLCTERFEQVGLEAMNTRVRVPFAN
ncbi:hypothetical protein [Vibrio vulnificus YJ016]|uniref:Uncharacterized protein n=1 Tax=Vibrio vulnificus (strain YJ016) TaxID=196600 RepID=Q7MIW9_VIBVY|nr:hypothetical protein [Vibrio vulnificus YJ016]